MFKEMDVCSRKLLTDPDLENVKEIYQLASPTSPKHFQTYPFETIDANTIGTKNMLEIARRYQARIVYALELAHLIKSLSASTSKITFHPLPESDAKTDKP
ncbi:hypothetical protein COJ96_25045 [Bacillus sp. AFS073361]|uniref:NAD-dependent epimerase/dehydratase family protein n=1 Tax=Bacillus sp. AFS073361 TaxID=2033511 RepID=UPI000BF59227|nr:NAD-dependent epimerase/dehydratase family protein [Bacillus sp. AFS073361]PFP22910.1 hypothetical protein COJ96_25045 [Bacillus sp. AFS073361]